MGDFPAVVAAVAAPVAAEAAPEAVVDFSKMQPAEGESIGDYARRVQKAQEAADLTHEDDSESLDSASISNEQSTERQAAKPAPKLEDLQALAKEGKFEEILAALGAETEGTKIPSKRFAKFRKWQKDARAALAAEKSSIEARRAEVEQRVTAVVRDYEGLAKAKRAWDEGDIVGALESAFGKPLDVISDLAMKQKLSSDPELFRLKRKLDAKEQADKEAQEQAARVAQDQQRAREEARYLQDLGGELGESTDSAVAKAAKIPSFVQSVMRAQLHFYKTQGLELSSGEAAAEVMKTLRAAHLQWSDVFGSSGGVSTEHTAGAGIEPQNTDRAGTSLESQRKGKTLPRSRVGNAPPVPLDDLPDDKRWELLRNGFVRDSRRSAAG